MDDQTDLSQSTQVAESTAPSPHIQAQPSKNTWAIPVAIVIGFGLIAAAIYFSGSKSPITIPGVNDVAKNEEPTTGEIRPVDESDHIRGNPNAPIIMVEYSDFDCPFCKNFHETMNRIMSVYGSEGKVAWVYRHFPLEQLHPSAPHIAQASECVAELGGNEAFWKFADLVFGERGTNEQTNITRLEEFATTAGVSAGAYTSCMEDGRTKEQVESDFSDGLNAGAKGTPYTLVLVGGQQGVISGAQSYETVSKIIDTLVGQLEGDAQ
jgi:protein-disulfide isomerase